MNVRLLRYNDPEIERKYYEDEYLRIIQVLTYQIYLGTLVSIVLVIMAFVEDDYLMYLISAAIVVILPIFAMVLAKKYPYKCNLILCANNIAWCFLISTVYMWTKEDIVKACTVTTTDSPTCSYLFVVGGGFYTLHLALLVGTNFLLSMCTFITINAIYVFTLLPPIPNLICLVVLAPLCVGVTSFTREKNARLYYDLINKYYIWYHIANNVLPQKFIVTKASQTQLGYQLVKANRRARKEFSINSNEELQQFINTIELKQETQQIIPVYEDTHHNLGGGPLDSQASKSLGAISQFSKKSVTSRQSNNFHTKTAQPRHIPLDVLMRREIRRQNSNEQEKDAVSSHNQGGLPLNQNPAGQHLLATETNNNNNNTQNQNLNTTTMDQAAMYIRNQKRQLYPLDDPQSATIKSRKSKKLAQKRTKFEKYKGVFKTDPEEKKKFQLTLVCYSKDENFQLIMIEEDSNDEREQVLDEQVTLYKQFSVNFANLMQNESNMLQFYLQQIRQNQSIQKKLNDLISDAFHLNYNLTSRINNFIEFFNIDSSKVDLNPKQFSLKKLIRDIAHTVDFRVKSNQTQLTISNECPAEQDIIYNDEKRLRHIIMYLLQDCIQNTPKGQIIISASQGAAEIGDGGDTALSGTIKINIRDNSSRKYQQLRNQDYFFSTQNLGRLIKNKMRSNTQFIRYFCQTLKQMIDFCSQLGYQDIEISVCKQILKRIGPQGNIFYFSEDRNANRVSFYIYTDLTTEGGNVNLSHTKILQDENQDDHHADEKHNLEFQAQIQNSDDDEDTYKDNNQHSPMQDNPQENGNNLVPGSNQNHSSIYLFHGVDSRQTGQQQGSGLLFSSQYQLPGVGGGGHVQVQGNQSDKYSSNQTHQIQQIQGGQSGHSSQNHSTVGLFNNHQQSSSLSSQSALHTQMEKLYSHNHHAQTQPDRRQIDLRKSSLRKSMSQLFDESDKIEDENPVSEVYIKELSQTSVRFKRDITRKMSHKTRIFKNSMDEMEYNSRLSSIQRVGLSNNYTGPNGLSSLNSISKSLVNNNIGLLIFTTLALAPSMLYYQ